MTPSEQIDRLRSALPKAMLRDRRVLARRLEKVERRMRNGREQEHLPRQIEGVRGRLEASIRKRAERAARLPNIAYPESLPITAKKDEIVRTIRDNQVIVVSGETGSGKSTQIPKMCLEAGRGIEGKIGCTQPRRIAAVTIAKRIAEELGEEFGKSVGYKIRFRDRTDPNAYVKIMTDGMLLAETQQDKHLSDYDTLIIDEAHERSLNIDFILGILRTLLTRRKDLKLIITSATIDTAKFSKAFDGAPVIEVSGRMYPVEVEYMPLDPELEEAGEVTYVDMAVQAVDAILKRRVPGDILIFMPTEQDILETCERLEGRQLRNTTVLPLFARLQGARQARVFSNLPGRKIVAATNVAETSLTIPGIKFVVDTGLARISRYVPRTRATSLPVSLVSQSSADQRKGRCGRVENGVCIRLYSEEDYASRPLYMPPEILRSNLAEVILRMVSLNLGDIAKFPFIDRPNPKSVKDGFDLLTELGAIVRRDQRPALTAKGRIMARMPLDPKISRMMLEAQKEGRLDEVAVIASALSIQDPRERPAEKKEQADQMHALFRDPDSDFITLLNIWRRYHRSWDALGTQNQMRKFCKAHYLSFNRMREWRDIHQQIRAILKEQQIENDKRPEAESRSLYDGIHRAILSGYLSNIALRKEKNLYQAAKGKEAMVHPGSTLFNKGPEWIVAAEMVKTSRLFARTAAKIDPLWLEELGGGLCKSSYSEPHWEKNRGEVRGFQQVTLYGLPIVPRRSVPYGPIDPEVAHEIFIRSALVEGDVRQSLPFLRHNRKLVEKVANLEDKLRRRDILVGEQALADFYSTRLKGIYDVRSLKRLIKERGGDDFLKMSEEDLLLNCPDAQALAQFPDHMTVDRMKFSCAYKFAPGKEDDGVTIKVPVSLASQVPAEQLDWVVPGLFKEKIAALIKGLPKRYRRRLVPVSDAVDVIVSEMKREDQPLATTLGRFVYRRFGVDIPAAEWPSDAIPEHLRMRISITDHKGREMESGRDLQILKQQRVSPSNGIKEVEAFKESREKWEKAGLTSWDFGPLPESVPLDAGLLAYPGLEPGDRCVAVRLFQTYEEALESHVRGVETLYALHFSKDLKFLKRVLSLPRELVQAADYFGGSRAVEKALFESHVRRLFRLDVRSPEAFLAQAEKIKPALLTDAADLLDRTAKVLEAYRLTRSAIHAMETSNKNSPVAAALCSEIRSDLNRLVPADFLDRYDPDRLLHLPRYLKAMQIRAERGIYDFEKDRRKAAAADRFVSALQKMKEGLSDHASDGKREALENFRWMTEELKVSLFAQELKTLYPVSEKRLEKAFKEIERMV